MRKLLLTLLFLVAGMMVPLRAEAEMRLVATIQPVHGIVSAIAEEAATPVLLIDGASSPHNFSLRPSDAEALQTADMVFWIGPMLEPGLAKGMETLAGDAEVISLADANGLTILNVRDIESFGDGVSHGHDDHDHDNHGHDDDHDHAGIDPHLWLFPENAIAMADEIRAALSRKWPERADLFSTNFERFSRQVQAKADEIEVRLLPYKGEPFLVLHDAYQYFETRFGLSASGIVMISPDVSPGAARLKSLEALIAERNIRCLFSEPQFDPRYLKLLSQNADLSVGTLDPLGSSIAAGPRHYLDFIEGMANAFETCLSEGG